MFPQAFIEGDFQLSAWIKRVMIGSSFVIHWCIELTATASILIEIL